jgi:ribonuclease E
MREVAEGDDDENGNGHHAASADEDGEAIGGLEDEVDVDEEIERRRRRILKRYKIQEVIRRRQIMLVQVVKEERGNKGAALTTYLSLAGRYCVLMPNTDRGGGISRKITSATDRKRLRTIVQSLETPKGMGLIVRTAGAKRTKADIKRDYDYLVRAWETIRDTTLHSVAPALIYEEEDLVKRAIRDLYDKDIDGIWVEGEAGFKEAREFMRMLMPAQAKKVQAYREPTPLFVRHRIEDHLAQIYSPVVPLKSGGYLVINQTEALVAVDVNSGRATRERNIDATAM